MDGCCGFFLRSSRPLAVLVASFAVVLSISCGGVTTFEPTAAFVEAEYSPYLAEGDAVIRGRAFLRTRDGDIEPAAGKHIYLDPATSYTQEWFERCVIDEDIPRSPGRGDPAYLWYRERQSPREPGPLCEPYHRRTRADRRGRFQFAGVPPGKYYLTSDDILWFNPLPWHFIAFDVDCIAVAGRPYARVEVTPGARRDVEVSRPQAFEPRSERFPRGPDRNDLLEALQDEGLDDRPIVQRLVALLAAPIPADRADAAQALGEVGTEAGAAVPTLLQALGDPAEEVRANAAEALGRIDPKVDAALLPLVGALRDPCSSVEYAATHALSRLTFKVDEKAVDALIALLEDERARRCAAIVLGRTGHRAARAVPALVHMLQDPDPYNREIACSALGHIGPSARDAAPALRARLADQLDRLQRATTENALRAVEEAER